MFSPIPHDLKERARINSGLDRFLSLATWSPAMGAMLICGVTPTPGRTEIPSEAPSLRDPSVGVKPRFIAEARRVLERWLDDCEENLSADLIREIPSAVDPIEFLTWAEESYDQTPDVMKPPWLRYWLAFAGFGQYLDAPMPAPNGLVDRAVQLEGFASVVCSGTASAPTSALDDGYVNKMATSIRRSRSSIAGLIVTALTRADTPRNPSSVWKQLVAIAEKEKPEGLQYVAPTLLRIAHRDAGWKDYDQDALGQFLARRREKAGL